MATKVWRVKKTVDHRSTTEQHHQIQASINYTTTASDDRRSKEKQKDEKEARIKNALAASGDSRSSKKQKHEKEVRIKNAVAASWDLGSSIKQKHEKDDRIKNVVAASRDHGSSKKQKHEKEVRIKSVVAASWDHGSSKRQKHEKDGIKNAVAAFGDSGSSKKQKHEKETRINVGISLDHCNLGPKKKLLVIPLRGICVYRAHRWFPETVPRNRRPDFRFANFLVYIRPYCVDFLRFCFKRFHVGLWSSAREKNLQGILTNVMGDLKNKLLFTWDQKHCTDSGFTCLEKQDKPLFFKELSHLWDKKHPNLPWSDGEFSASNTLLITNPVKALLNPPNTAIFLPALLENTAVSHAIFRHKCVRNSSLLRICHTHKKASNLFVKNHLLRIYDPENRRDDLLGPNSELRVFLNGLVEAEDVQSYVKSHPIGDPEITPSHPDWDYYCKIICSFNKKRNGGDQVKLI